MEAEPVRGQEVGNGDEQPRTSTTPRKTACLHCRGKKLRCDALTPTCSNCARSSITCHYAKTRRKTGPKKGYLSSLERRLVRAERLFERQGLELSPDETPEPCTPATQGGVGSTISSATVVHECHSTTDQPRSPHTSVTDNRLEPVDLLNASAAAASTSQSPLDEPYPPEECTNELHQIYFSKIHPTIPIIHPQRYLSTSVSTSVDRVPACLRYIIWSSAAAISDKYRQDQDELYRRARKYAQVDEMSSYGDRAVSLAHCQTWLLISHYEIRRVLSPRTWLSIGKAARLAQMLQLFRLDDPTINLKNIVQPPRDWAELEESRHVFWMAFCLDRYASMATGWPTILDEEDILTSLPLSNDPFDENAPMPPITLQQAYEVENVKSTSAQNTVIILASLAGRILKHLKRAARNGNASGQPQDFWDAHQDIDTDLLNLGLVLPETLRLPLGVENPSVIFIHLMLHGLTICLHQVAVLKAQKCSKWDRLGTESKERCVASALAITSIMRQANHTDMATMHVVAPFYLFVAARILYERVQGQPAISEYRRALQFLNQMLERLKKTNSFAEMFLLQFRLMERVHKEGERQEDRNASTEEVDEGSPGSLSFTHSMHPIFEPRDGGTTTIQNNSRMENTTAVSTATPINNSISNDSVVNYTTNTTTTNADNATIEAPPLAGAYNSPNGTSSTTPNINHNQIFSRAGQVGLQDEQPIFDNITQQSNWMDLEMFPLLPFFPQTDGGHLPFSGGLSMWNSSSGQFASSYDDRGLSVPQAGRENSYSPFFGNDS